MSLFEIQVSHQFRKGNQVADLLEKMGAQRVMQRFPSCGDLPEQAQGLVWLDHIGVPYLCK